MGKYRCAIVGRGPRTEMHAPGVRASALERRVVELPFDPPEDLTARGIAVFEGKRGAV